MTDLAAPRMSAEVPREDDCFFLPLLGDVARERGFKLPLPLGVGASFMFINRPTEITSVKAAANNNPLNQVNFLAFDAKASVSTAILRLDAWVLPFLNVYFLGGYIWNESTVNMTVDLPGAPDTPLTSDGDLEGPTYGGGVTLAGGYKEFFATFDINLTRSDLGNLSQFDAMLTSVRAGWNTNLDGPDVRVYTGATYWDTKRTIEGTFNTISGGPIQSIQFAVDQEPVDPLTILLGTSATITESFWMMLELQAWDGTQALLGGATLRF